MRKATKDQSVLTVDEFASENRISQGTTLYLIESKQINAYNAAPRAGGKPQWRIPIEEVQKFREARGVRPATPQPNRRKSKHATDSGHIY